MKLLEIENLQVNYGPIAAVKGINMSIEEGTIVALLGANGAGKTTTLRTISGVVKASGGSIKLAGEEILNKKAYKIASMGINQSPEGRLVFYGLNVEDNLKAGAYSIKSKKQMNENLERVYKLFPILKDRRKQQASTLSGGEQQMLAMGRALMSHPKIILMDEPSMGLSPIFVEEVFKIIRDISAEGVTVLLVEQNAKKALNIADRAYVLETGNIILQGDAKKLMNDESVKKAYLGE